MIPTHCPILGVPIEVLGEDRNRAASIDRLNPNLGYVPGNVAVISLRANRIKSDATIEELEKLVAWIRSRKGIGR